MVYGVFIYSFVTDTQTKEASNIKMIAPTIENAYRAVRKDLKKSVAVIMHNIIIFFFIKNLFLLYYILRSIFKLYHNH